MSSAVQFSLPLCEQDSHDAASEVKLFSGWKHVISLGEQSSPAFHKSIPNCSDKLSGIVSIKLTVILLYVLVNILESMTRLVCLSLLYLVSQFTGNPCVLLCGKQKCVSLVYPV